MYVKVGEEGVLVSNPNSHNNLNVDFIIFFKVLFLVSKNKKITIHMVILLQYLKLWEEEEEEGKMLISKEVNQILALDPDTLKEGADLWLFKGETIEEIL